jgi:hypothetical protein
MSDGNVKSGVLGPEALRVSKSFEGMSIVDMFNYWYGTKQGAEVAKSDAPVVIGTTGAYNPIYSAQLMFQVVNDPNGFSALGMLPYKHSGYRAVTAKSGATVAVAEAAATGDSKKPTIAHVQVKPGIHWLNYDMGTLEMALEGKDDVPSFAELSAYMAAEFMGYTDINVLKDIASGGAWSVGFDSLQRLIATYAYLTAEPAANELDPWSTLDRDAGASWSDAQMDTGTVSGDTETDLIMSLSRLDNLFQKCMPYWAGGSVKNKVIITGFDMDNRIQAMLQSQQMWTGYEGAQTDVNGAKTLPGRDAGFMVATYNKVPIIPDFNMATDGISRLALVDKDHLGVALVTPLMAFDTGPDVVNTAMYTGTLTRRGAFLLQGQIWCDKFKGQGMITGAK